VIEELIAEDERRRRTRPSGWLVEFLFLGPLRNLVLRDIILELRLTDWFDSENDVPQAQAD